MGIRIVTLGPEHLPAVVAFSEKTWDRPRRPEFCRWRYLDAPFHRTLLAMRGSECVALLSAFTAPYRMAGASSTCLETADWFCLPELRTSGLGIRLMRAVMEEPHPIVAVGGSTDTLRLLPRLGWKRVGDASRFVRWLGSGRVVRWLARIWRGTTAPPGGSAEAPGRVAELDGELNALYAEKTECGMVPLPLAERMRWIGDGMVGRRLAVLSFRIDGRLRGWSLVRLDITCPAREALIIELFAPSGEASLYPWMVAETWRLAASAGCRKVVARTSCPNLRAALRGSLFQERLVIPVHVWPARNSVPPGPLHLGSHTADSPLRPYPGASASWDRGRP